jgi:hypothetical protein
MVIQWRLYYTSFCSTYFALFNFDNGYILLFIFLPFTLSEGNKKKEIHVIYLYEFKLGRSAAQTARTV